MCSYNQNKLAAYDNIIVLAKHIANITSYKLVEVCLYVNMYVDLEMFDLNVLNYTYTNPIHSYL